MMASKRDDDGEQEVRLWQELKGRCERRSELEGRWRGDIYPGQRKIHEDDDDDLHPSFLAFCNDDTLFGVIHKAEHFRLTRYDRG